MSTLTRSLRQFRGRHACRCCRDVNTWSPLTATFNKLNISRLIRRSKNVGLFGIPELQSSRGFDELKSNAVASARKLVDQSISSSPATNVVGILDELSDGLCKVADLAEYVRLAHPDRSFAKAAERASFEINNYVEQLNTHFDLYKSLADSLQRDEQLRGEGAAGTMDAVTRNVGDLLLFDFEQSGIHLNKQERETAVQLHYEVLTTGAEFSQYTQADRLLPMGEWPQGLDVPFNVERGNIVVDNVYSEARSPQIRESCYRAYMASEPSQLALFERMLTARSSLAHTLGFESFAQRALNGNMAESPERVETFLSGVLERIQAPVARELERIRSYKVSDVGVMNGTVMPWDVRYYTSLITSRLFTMNSNQLSEYFSLGGCMHGLDIIFTSLYGVSLKVVEAEEGELWSDDIQKIAVTHESEGVLGYIYCDFFYRHGKLPQDSHFTIRGGRELADGTYQSPIVCLYCNFMKPLKGSSSLLSLSQVENLFHEMGHAMHSMLGRARYQHVTGTRCATDFAEVPSILMEYFAMDKRLLPLYAKHYQTGEPLPDKIIESMCLSRKQFSAIELETQAFYSIVDQKFHGRNPLEKSSVDVLTDMHREYTPGVPHEPGTAWHLRFGHFHSYAAKYYSYLWSRAVASRVWHECFEADPLSRSAGERYRRTMLAHGGGIHPQKLVEDMLGRPVSINDLVNSLEEDVSNT